MRGDGLVKNLKRNETSFYYCLYDSESFIKDEHGNDTGNPVISYKNPVEMRANISPATGYAQTEQFGNLDQYDKVIVTHDMSCPIDEQSVLFIDREPELSENGEWLYDYVVRRVAKSLNVISIAISKVTVR